MPLSFIPKKANAQSISGYASGLAATIALLPQCGAQELIGSGIRSLFNGISHLFSDIPTNDETTQAILNLPGNSGKSLTKEDLDKLDQRAKATLKDKASSAANKVFGVQIVLPDTTETKLNTIQANTQATKEATESINANSKCIQSIGRLIIKMLLQKMTVSTINWINSGFDGSPAFIQNPGKFFNDIRKNEILQFGIEINNPQLFPFGKAWMKNTAAAFNNKFQDNARYSLNELIQQTNPEFNGETFQTDFSQGGWDAWTAMTQVPANNPLGFKLLADNEIQRRLAGTSQSTAEALHESLAQAGGFLGDMRCSSNTNITQQQKTAALTAGKEDPCLAGGGSWEYVTPGKLIAEKATEVVGYQNNAYLNVQDLNDAVAAILDSLLSKFSSNLMEKGFANLGDEGADGRLIVDERAVGETYRTQTEKDFMPAQLASSWLSANPNFNIRTDLTQALIDEQRTYSDKLALQNKELISTTDGKAYKLDNTTGISNTYGLIPAIYQLDYCIPGPHPGWEEDSRRTLAAATGTILPETQETLKNKSVEQIVGMAKSILPMAGAAVGAVVLGPLAGTLLGLAAGSAVLPVVGSIVGAIVGTLVSFAVGLFSSSSGEEVRAYYATVIGGFTGFTPTYDVESDDRALNLESKQGAVQVLNTMLDRYSVIMNKIYFSDPEILPAISKEASSSYEQLPGYYQMIKNNTDEIALLKNTVNTLGEIKSEVDRLNKEFPNGGDEYENRLKAEKNAFGRISASMVNGDDIASADNLLKQIKDKRDYIYKNLLKGPYGCEVDLEKPQKKFPSANPGVREANQDWSNFDANSVQRMTYPFPILYDYNKFKKGDTIPDPWNSGYKNNKIPDAGPGMYGVETTGVGASWLSNLYLIDSGNPNFGHIYGPGFLSFVHFSAEGAGDLRRGSERLKIHDLLPLGHSDNPQDRLRAVGNKKTIGEDMGGPFETIIGIY